MPSSGEGAQPDEEDALALLVAEPVVAHDSDELTADRLLAVQAGGGDLCRRLGQQVQSVGSDAEQVVVSCNTESWRPETGNLLFGPNDEYFFAWTPFVPSAR